MTKAFLIVSVACNVWFLFLLFYDRIMDMKLIRFFRHIAGLWRSLDSTVAEQGKDKEIPHADTSDIIGKSRFKMASTRTTAANAAKCANGYGQEKTGSDFRKDEGRGKPLSVFLEASEINTRQCIYISREVHEKVAVVASRMGKKLSIGKFVDNILRDHFREYGAQYMEQIENAQKVRL